MASTYFVKGGGSNTAPYDTWAKAATSLQTALTAATTTGDIIVLDKDDVPSGDAELASDTTYTFGGNCTLVAATDDDTGTAYTPTAMGTGSWIGNSTTNRSVTLAGGYMVSIFGLTIRVSGSTADSINIGTTAGADYSAEECYLWMSSTSSTAAIVLGASSGSSESWCEFKNCTFRFGHASQKINLGGGRQSFIGGSVSASGTAPTGLFGPNNSSSLVWIGGDLSFVTGTLFGDQTGGFKSATLAQCKLGSGVTVMASQTTYGNRSQCEVFVFDCASGDEHYHLQHHNALGSLTISTSVYVTSDGAAYNTTGTKHSWKIDTTANASFASPYISPWISVHHEGTSAITPYLEALRHGSTTAFKESELWSEWMVKATTGNPLGTWNVSDRGGVKASTTNQGSSSLTASDWTGEHATDNVYHKLAPTSSVTPAEIGDLCARVCFGAASSTIYVDPLIRGRT